MTLELDHIFIGVQSNAPEAQALLDFGLAEGRRRAHPGQGTTNICFFFQNAFLELLWLVDEDEARSPLIAPTGLWERCRWQSTAACPFGIAVRTTHPLPFNTWDYRPPYLPPDLSIPIAANSAILQEPLLFRSPSNLPPSALPPEQRPPLDHPCGVQVITSVKMTLPTAKLSPEMKVLQSLGLIELEYGEYHLQLEMDQGDSASADLSVRHHSFAPELPLSMRY
jgi:Glyoxalase-like domain